MDEKLKNNPYYQKALEYIKNTDLNALEPGKHEIDGDNVWVNIVDSELRTTEKAKFEVHDLYIDIQIPLSGAEGYGIKPRCECTEPIGEMNVEKDILKYNDRIIQIVCAAPGEAMTFQPHEAHAPLVGTGTIHKAIFKVKVV